MQGLATPHSAEVKAAVDALNKLKQVLDPASAILQVSIYDIESSFDLRQSLISEASQIKHLLSNKQSVEFKKEYNSRVQEHVD